MLRPRDANRARRGATILHRSVLVTAAMLIVAATTTAAQQRMTANDCMYTH
jgi:hypothetical protein